MVKFVVLFDPSIDRTKESLLLLAFFQYLDRSNVYETLTSGRRRVIQEIGGMTAFPSSTVLIRESSEHERILTLPGLIKSSLELETDLFAFLRNEELFQGKNYIAFVNLLRATTMQKKSEFHFLSFAAYLRFCLILVRICSYKSSYSSLTFLRFYLVLKSQKFIQ